MEISDKLLCLFNADVVEEDGRFLVEIPPQEIDTETVEAGTTYRIAIISREKDVQQTPVSSETMPREPQPPVEVGEIRYVEVEDIGKQGDGIARVERGYVIIVPGAEIGEQVKIEVTDVKSNFAVGEIVDEEF